jgi:hypothetical protein
MAVQLPDSLLASGTAEGLSAAVGLPEDGWDLLGLEVPEALSEKELQVLNGQVALLTSAEYAAEQNHHRELQREAARQRWQHEAEQRIARMEAKKKSMETVTDQGIVMKASKFTWNKEGQKAFEWRKIHHALVNNVGTMTDGGLFTESVITPTAMRMYTDHRVMGAIVLPGVSHISLMAATGAIGFPSPGGMANDWHMSIKETLFERPYIVNSGAELISAMEAGTDLAQAGMLPIGVPTIYCRASAVTKERGQIKPNTDWTK